MHARRVLHPPALQFCLQLMYPTTQFHRKNGRTNRLSALTITTTLTTATTTALTTTALTTTALTTTALTTALTSRGPPLDALTPRGYI